MEITKRHSGMDPLYDMLKLAPAGPRIEFGVYRGKRLKIISEHAGETIGVDSFEGMAEPTIRDYDGKKCRFKKGKLSAPIEHAKEMAPKATLIKGFVPEVLAKVPDGPYAFAHLDMDQYAPTKAALEWLCGRMLPCGIILCHDWDKDDTKLAAGALNEFAERTPFFGTDAAKRSCWWIV